MADKRYDADTLRDWLKEQPITAVIPPKANRKVQRDSNWYLYKERHVVECMFGKLKCYRRIATYFEKRPAISKKFWPLPQFCCDCAHTSTEPKELLQRFLKFAESIGESIGMAAEIAHGSSADFPSAQK